MKTILLIIGIAAVVTACVMIPKPKVSFESETDFWVRHYKAQHRIDSMEQANVLFVYEHRVAHVRDSISNLK